MYVVTLTKTPTVNDFRADFFPRRVRTKADAKELVAEVVHKGGEATIEKAAGKVSPAGGKA